MPQLHLYLPKDIAAAIKRQAQAKRISVSGYLAELVRGKVRGGSWPHGFFDEVVGGWVGEPLRRSEQGDLERRVTL